MTFEPMGTLRRGMRYRHAVALLALLLTGCAAPTPPACGEEGEPIALLQRGIHTELMLPRSLVEQGLPAIAQRHPAATTIAFGFGKQGVVGVDEPSILAILASGLPGPAVVEVTSITAMPEEAVRLRLPEAGRAPLLAFLREAIAAEEAEVPDGARPDRSFHPAAYFYTLAYNCNTWLADALARAGLPFLALPGQTGEVLMAPARRVPGACHSTAQIAGLRSTARTTSARP
jgi:hypothetical protein